LQGETFIVQDCVQTLLLRAMILPSVMLKLMPDRFRGLIGIRLD